MTRPYDPQYPRPLVTPQAEHDFERDATQELEREQSERTDAEAAELGERDKWDAYYDGIRELSAGEWREAIREEQTDT